MKNFTNNFKQFTSRLSARWLIMALMLLLGTSSAWGRNYDGTEKLYFKMDAVSWWNCGTDGNQNFAYFFNNSTNKNAWSAHAVKVENNIYYVLVPKGDWKHVILTRNSVTSSPSFSNKYNQTGDIAIDASKNYITKFSENSTTATWGTYTPPASVTGYELAGFGNEGWNSPIAMTASNGVYTCTKQLSIDDYIGDPNGFKILERYSDGSTKYYGNNGSMTRGECTGWTMDSNTSTANCGLYTDVVGNYTFSFTASTKKLTVTFPTACTPPTNNKKVVIKSTSRAYVYAWTADANETKLLGGWPGTQMSNDKVGNYYSIEIPTETDVKIILNNGSGTQTGDIGPLTKGKEYTYQFTLGETTYKELRSTCLEPGCDDPAKPTIKINGGTGSVSTCGENGTLTIDANHVAGSYKLFTKSGDIYTEKGTISNKTIQVTTTGTYVVRAYNGDCMTESDAITFTKNTKPTISASTLTSQSICSGEKATLTVTSGKGIYTWGNTNGGENISDTDNSVQVSTAGTYTVTATDGNNCSSNAVEFTVTVKELQGKPVFTTPNTTVCESTAFNLPAIDKNGATLVWYTSNGVSQNTSVPAGITTQTVYYAAIAASDDKCETASNNRTAYTVNVDAKPAITLASPSSICTGTEIDLTKDYVTSKTGTVTWYSDANRSQEITNGIVTPINTGTSQTTKTYYAKVTNGVCSAKTDVSLSIKVDPQPAITLKAAPTICNGTTVTFANYVNTYTGTVTWHTDANCTSAAITTAKPSQTTTYYAKATSGNCTPAKASLKVTVNDKPAVPTLSADKTSLVSPDKATLTAGNTTNGLTYTLYNGETPGESQTSTGGNLNFKVGEAGNYTVRVSNSCGTSTSTPAIEITVCTPQTNEFRHANSSYTQLANQPTYYPGDKAYFVSTGNCCLTGTWSANLQKGEEGWWTGLTGSTPRFSMTLTRAGEFTITNMATNGCTQDKNVRVDLDFTVTALSQVTNANGTASGADIALTWEQSANHTKVMVVRYPTAGTETIPAGGQSYSAGNTLGEGTVVYVGTSESYTDKSLPSGESYKYYFYTVNNNYYSDGVVLNMSSCAIPAKPSLSSTAITACNGECTSQGYITITNMNDYKDDTYTFELGNSVVTPDANGKLGINSTAYTQYTVTVTNSCGNPNSATVDIAINDNTPTISGPTSTLPGISNAIELTVPTGSDTKWTVNNNGDLSAATGASTMFSAEDEREYTVTANYNGCTDTHIITVANGYTVYLRRPHAKDETTQYNYWFEKSTAAGPGYIKFGTVKASPSDSELYEYNGGSGAETAGDLGTKGTESFTDCDGYVWDAYNIGIDVTALYFHAPNDKSTNGTTYGGYATYTRSYSQNDPISSDLYFTMGNWSSGMGRTLTKVEKPFEGIEIEALGSTEICSNNMASFAALYLKSNCTGKEIKTYAWKYSNNNSNWAPYTTGKGATSNNIRPNVAGHYRLECELEDGNKVVSNSIEITTKTCTISNTDLNNITSNLPIIMVNTGNNNNKFPSVSNGKHCSASADDLKKKRSVDVKIIWNPNGTVNSTDAYSNGANLYYDRKARMNYRGSSSLNFEKKSFAFCPGDENCGQDDDKSADYVKTKKMNMFGIGEAEDKDWVLYAAYVDPSMMRNILAMETYSAMTGKWGVKNKYVELYIDGEYQGVYVFMDKVTQNKKRVDIKWDVKDDTKRDFILKFDKTDVADRYEDASGDQKTFESDMTGKTGISTYDTEVDQRFEIEYPEKEDIMDDGGYWSDVYSFVLGKVNEFESALSKGDFTTVRSLINYESWADFFIINEFTKNVDAYRASCIFVYTGGKFEAWPLWDYELSFNNTVTGSGKGRGETTGLLIEHSDVYSDEFPAPFWWTGKYNGSNMYSGLLKDPCFVQMIKTRWAEHTKAGGPLNPSTTTAKTAAYKKILDAQGAATREFTKWPVTSRGKDACNNVNTGYFDYGGDGSNTTYANSYKELNDWLAAGARIKGLQAEIDELDDIIEFGITSTVDKDETTPWRAVNVKVDAVGADYTYTVTPEIVKGQVIQGSDNLLIYAEPATLPQTYTVVTTLNAKDQCGGKDADNASSRVTFTVNDLVENCEE